MPGETTVRTPVQDVIQQANQTFAELFSTGDPAGMARCYTEDAVIMPPNQELIHGRNNIEGFWRGMMTAGVRSVQLESHDIEQYGEILAEIGRFSVIIEANEVIDEGKYLVLWKQENGEWKLFRDIWNSSRSIATR